MWLEPVLQKLDFGVGEFIQKIKENHGTSGIHNGKCEAVTNLNFRLFPW